MSTSTSHSQPRQAAPACSSDPQVAAAASPKAEEPNPTLAAGDCSGQLHGCDDGVVSAKTSLSRSPDAARSDVAVVVESLLKAVSECPQGRGLVAGTCVIDEEAEGSKSRDRPKHGSEGQTLDAGKFKGRERKNFPKQVVDELQSWFYSNISHPYPNEQQKGALAQSLGISHSQVSYWFVNARKRLWKPYVSEQEPSSTNVSMQPDASPSAGCARALNASQSFEELQQKLFCRMNTGQSPPTHGKSATASLESILSDLLSSAHPWLPGHSLDSRLPDAHPHPSTTAPPAAAQPTTLPQKIQVLKSKVGRPPKKRPKLGQPNSHFTESFMTQPASRIDARAASVAIAPRSPAPPTPAATSKPAASELSTTPGPANPPLHTGLADYIHLVQQQFVDAQQRLSNAFALAQLQQPGIARSAASDYSNSAAAIDPALLQYLHQSQGSLIPLLDGRVHNQSGYSLPHLGSLQQNAEMARNQQLLQMHQHLMFQQQAASQQMPTLLPDVLSYYPQLRDSVCLGKPAPQ